MQITYRQELAPNIHFAGNAGVCLYVFTGEKNVMVDNGLRLTIPVMANDLDELIGGADKLDLNLITHSHYDHIAGTTFLRQQNPDLSVAAHPRVADVVQRANAVELIRKLDKQVIPKVFLEEYEQYPEFESFEITRTLKDGETIDIGKGIQLEVIYTPGHTQDSISFYEPGAKLLIPAEAAGMPSFDGSIQPEFTQGYSNYMASLEKMAKLEVKIIGFPHVCCLVGDAAKEFIPRSIQATIQFKDEILQTLDDLNNEHEQVMSKLTEKYYGPNQGQPKEAFLINLDAMIRVVRNEFANG